MCHRECKSMSFKRRKIQLMICYFPSNKSAVPLPYHWLHQPLFYLIMPLKWLYLLCSLWSTSPWSAPVLQPGQSVWPPIPYPSVTHTQKTLTKAESNTCQRTWILCLKMVWIICHSYLPMPLSLRWNLNHLSEFPPTQHILGPACSFKLAAHMS